MSQRRDPLLFGLKWKLFQGCPQEFDIIWAPKEQQAGMWDTLLHCLFWNARGPWHCPPCEASSPHPRVRTHYQKCHSDAIWSVCGAACWPFGGLCVVLLGHHQRFQSRWEACFGVGFEGGWKRTYLFQNSFFFSLKFFLSSYLFERLSTDSVTIC